MKRFLFLFAATFALSMFATSCDDSGDLEDNYLPPSVGIDTSYSPNIVAIVPGYERVEVIWELNNIENEKEILASYIYWNGGKGVHEAVISKLDYTEYNGVNYYRQIFDIPEGDYSIFIRNLDSDKYVSAESKSLDVSVYGAVAQSQLMDRPIKSATFDANKIYTLTWDESETCAGSTITYTKSTNQIVTNESPADDESVALLDAVETGDITIETVHLPSRTVVRPSVDADDALSLDELMGETYFNVAQAGLDTIAAPAATKQMLGDGTKFYYVKSLEELQALIEAWETDFRTDEEIAAGADIVSYADVTSESSELNTQRLQENLARKSNVNIKMLAGRYVVDKDMAGDDIYRLIYDIYKIDNTSLLPITGNNNYFDLTGVEFIINTDAISTFVREMHMLYVIGDNNTIVNGTFANEGSPYDDPGGKGGGNGAVVDGRKNLLLGVKIDAMGSIPYGYGELFGKGSITTLNANKHCGMLVRGEFNTIDGCWIRNRSFGHLLYMQGAYEPVIKNTYVQGAFSTTDEVLMEEGFGTKADNIDFLTAYFYRVPAGYALPLGEDSYRTYASGGPWFRDPVTLLLEKNYACEDATDLAYFTDRDGNPYTSDMYKSTNIDGDGARLTKNPQLIDCVVKDGRAGISLALGQCGKYPVKRVTLHGSQGGLCPASGQILEDCASDIMHGPTIGLAYDTHNSIVADITIIPYEGEHYNYNGTARDNGYVANIKGGLNHQMTFHAGAGLFYEDNAQIGKYNSGINSGAYFQMAGDNTSYGELAEVENANLSGGYFKNESYYPIRLGNRAGETYGEYNDGCAFYVRIGSYITVESEYGTRLDPNNPKEVDAFWKVVNRNHFYLHDAENLDNAEATQNGATYKIIPCPYGTKGVWVVKAIDMTKLREEKGFPIYHTDLEAYIKTL